MNLEDYMWLVVVGSLAAFVYGFGTGSNDVANAFGTSVGAKTLTLKQAVIIAAIFEFTGALVLGRVSTATIAGGIADINAFLRAPEIYAYGMVCALTVAGFWQILSSYLEYNTSSTHSIIGCIMGFSLVYAGSAGVLWYVPDPASFPPYKGLVPIVCSWFFSPILCCLASGLLFLLLRWLVIRRSNAFKLTFFVLPCLVGVTMFLCLYFVFTKGAKKSFTQDDDTWTDSKAAWIAACVAAGCTLLTGCAMPFLLRYANKRFAEDIAPEDKQASAADLELPSKSMDVESDNGAKVAMDLDSIASVKQPQPEEPAATTFMGKMRQYSSKGYGVLMHGMNVDIHATVDDDPLVAKIHAHAEKFDPKVEYVFKYLQVFSACAVCFAHGAGEVGYMAGPLATVWTIVENGQLVKNVTAPIWIILIGAFGLVVGLATYGYNVVRSMGVRLAKLSPSRGFCAEISTAFVIMIAAQFGLPTSSSQVITGGIIGVGLCEGVIGVNWAFFGWQFLSWIATLFICGVGTAALFSMGVYAPSIQCSNQVIFYENQLTAYTSNVSTTMSNVFLSYNASATAGAIPGMTADTVKVMSATLKNISAGITAQTGTVVQTADPTLVMDYFYRTLSIYQNYSINSIGQTTVKPRSTPICNNNVTADILANVTTACPRPTLVPAANYMPY